MKDRLMDDCLNYHSDEDPTGALGAYIAESLYQKFGGDFDGISKWTNEGRAAFMIKQRLIDKGVRLNDYPDALIQIFFELGFKQIPFSDGDPIRRVSKKGVISYAERICKKNKISII